MFACLHASGAPEGIEEALYEVADHFSPSIEATGPSTIVFSVDGLEKLFGTPRELASEIARQGAERGIDANVAIASNPDAALHAARHFPGVTLIPAGQETQALGEIPLSELSMPAQMHDTLLRWGIRTFSEFAALPPLGILERFGMEGLQLQDTARGMMQRPLMLSRGNIHFQRGTELEHALDNLQSLLFLVNGLLVDLCREMHRHGVATHELRLVLQLEHHPAQERVLSFPVPAREAASMLKLLQLHLESNPPPSAITAFTLHLAPVEPRMAQSGLFCPAAPEPARLQITLARIGGIVGHENVGSAELLDTYRPDGFLLRPFSMDRVRQEPQQRKVSGTRLIPRLYRPPLMAKVMLEKGHPCRVAALGISGNVMSWSGPWRGSGDWWNHQAWGRDEWDVALSDGGLYRIYRELSEQEKWFVAGVYD